jgi:hypothetical protein
LASVAHGCTALPPPGPELHLPDSPLHFRPIRSRSPIFPTYVLSHRHFDAPLSIQERIAEDVAAFRAVASSSTLDFRFIQSPPSTRNALRAPVGILVKPPKYRSFRTAPRHLVRPPPSSPWKSTQHWYRLVVDRGEELPTIEGVKPRARRARLQCTAIHLYYPGGASSNP